MSELINETLSANMFRGFDWDLAWDFETPDGRRYRVLQQTREPNEAKALAKFNADMQTIFASDQSAAESSWRAEESRRLRILQEMKRRTDEAKEKAKQ